MTSLSQEQLPLTKDFKRAVDMGTRTLIGKPGENYWQNTADYEISATILPSENVLIGSEKIIYQNNSKDELNTIIIHLFQHLYKNREARDSQIDQADITNGMLIDSLFVNSVADVDFNIKGTQLIINLNEPLQPSNKLELRLHWQFQIPTKNIIRMGGKDESSFFLGQWYPKIAGYDDIKGWDRNVHFGNQKFCYDKGN